jgi:hypothetical protein
MMPNLSLMMDDENTLTYNYYNIVFVKYLTSYSYWRLFYYCVKMIDR